MSVESGVGSRESGVGSVCNLLILSRANDLLGRSGSPLRRSLAFARDEVSFPDPRLLTPDS
jgi:hypothetical protein